MAVQRNEDTYLSKSQRTLHWYIYRAVGHGTFKNHVVHLDNKGHQCPTHNLVDRSQVQRTIEIFNYLTIYNDQSYLPGDRSEGHFRTPFCEICIRMAESGSPAAEPSLANCMTPNGTLRHNYIMLSHQCHIRGLCLLVVVSRATLPGTCIVLLSVAALVAKVLLTVAWMLTIVRILVHERGISTVSTNAISITSSRV